MGFVTKQKTSTNPHPQRPGASDNIYDRVVYYIMAIHTFSILHDNICNTLFPTDLNLIYYTLRYSTVYWTKNIG